MLVKQKENHSLKKKSLFNTVVEGAHLLVHVLESPPPRGVITWQMIRIRLLLSGVSTQGSKAQESSFTFPVNTSATERCSPGTRLLRAVPSTFSFLPEFVLPLSTIKGSHLQPPIRTNLPANWSVLLYSAPVYLGLCRLQNH